MKNTGMKQLRFTKQRGIALPLVVIGMVAMLAMAGMAIDSSHAFVNKTRLQNTADAAALTAAKVYDQTSDTILGSAAANAQFGMNTDGSGNFEVDAAFDAGDISVVVQWSPTLNPFTPSAVGPYVRVIATGFNMTTTFSRIVGINDIAVISSAVAGPSPTIDYACNIAPLLACANDVDAPYFGFETDRVMVLKPNPGNHGDVGPGNYKLLRLNCPGGACVRDAMAGEYDACASTDQTVDTEPGVTAGPTSQGFNTRFGIYAGPVSPDDYPPDVVVTEVSPNLDTYPNPAEDPSDPFDDDIITWNGTPVTYSSEINYNHVDYQSDVAAGQLDYPSTGVEGRRILALPVADCSGDETGQSTITVEGFACFFMLQPIEGGPEKNIYGEYIQDCLAGGLGGPNPGAGPGPYLIQLYKDPDSGDS